MRELNAWLRETEELWTGQLARLKANLQKPAIGLIGSGSVGSALGRSWARAGYEVMFSSRNLDHDVADHR